MTYITYKVIASLKSILSQRVSLAKAMSTMGYAYAALSDILK